MSHLTCEQRYALELMLEEGLSKSIIALSLKVHKSTIYMELKRKGDLYLHLRHKGRKYRKRGNQKDSRGILTGRVGIEKLVMQNAIF